MPNPMIRIHNTETDQIIDREMTKVEYEQYLKDIADSESRREKMLEAKTKKQEILNRLGLTEDEARILLG